ncbi:MAG: hypothetical protein K9J13_03825 [Saprospiraceae bacterium]|nr:hypothetical protein [Saprospiraceae bacterium]
MKRTLIAILLVSLVFTLFAQNNSYKVTGTHEINCWSPVFGEESRLSAAMLDLLYLKLLNINEIGEIIPVILSEYPQKELLETGQGVLHLNLRDDIFWQDGTSVTTYDVEFTWKVIQNSDVTNLKEKTSCIADMIIINDCRMDIVFESNSEYNYGALNIYLLPKHILYDPSNENPYIIDAENDFFTKNPLANGKFLPIKISDDYCLLEKNINYLQPVITENLLDSFSWSRETNFDQIISGIIHDKYNFVLDVPANRIPDFNNLSDFGYLVTNLTNSFQMIAFNLRRVTFQDYNLRLLFQYAIDKNSLNMNYLNNTASIISGPFPRSGVFYNNSFNEPALDYKEKIDEKIREFGFEKTDTSLLRFGNKVGPFNLVVNKNNQEDLVIANGIKAMVKEKLLIDINIISIDSKGFYQRIFDDHDFDLTLAEFSFGTDPSVYTVFHSEFISPGGYNICGLENQDLDILLEEGRKADGNIKIEVYHQQHAILGNLLPGIFLFQKSYSVFVGKEFIVTPETLNSSCIFRHIENWTKP